MRLLITPHGDDNPSLQYIETFIAHAKGSGLSIEVLEVCEDHALFNFENEDDIDDFKAMVDNVSEVLLSDEDYDDDLTLPFFDFEIME